MRHTHTYMWTTACFFFLQNIPPWSNLNRNRTLINQTILPSKRRSRMLTHEQHTKPKSTENVCPTKTIVRFTDFRVHSILCANNSNDAPISPMQRQMNSTKLRFQTAIPYAPRRRMHAIHSFLQLVCILFFFPVLLNRQQRECKKKRKSLSEWAEWAEWAENNEKCTQSTKIPFNEKMLVVAQT